MPIPICPLLMQARASIPLMLNHYDITEGRGDPDGPAAGTPETAGPLYEDPSKAPGVACIGSRCAAWKPAPDDVAMVNGQKVYAKSYRGRCGHLNGAEYPDPAEVK